MKNDLTLELGSGLSVECTRNGVHCQSEGALEIIRELTARRLNFPTSLTRQFLSQS